MSTFRVKLTQGDSRTGGGNLDENAQDGNYSIQRTMYAMGPNKINRKLKDGDTFTDCNYWKRFAYPQVPYNEAFIQVVSDDGSVYVDGEESLAVRAYNKTVTGGSTYSTSGNSVDILGDTGGYGRWATITTNADIQVKVNGLSTSIFTVEASTSHTFQAGDVLISSLQLAKSASGNATVEVLVGVVTQCSS
jgi:hypothetical protein